jgi:hypothetical protein
MDLWVTSCSRRPCAIRASTPATYEECGNAPILCRFAVGHTFASGRANHDGRGASRPDPSHHSSAASPVTSLVRTVLDLCRTIPFEQAVAAGDRVLRIGLVAAAVEEALALVEGWPGTRQARRAISFLDARSESAGESVSRVRIHESCLLLPSHSVRSTVWTEGSSRGLTSVGKSSGPSASLTERSNTAGCSSLDSRLKRRFLMRNGVRIRFVILVDRSCGGSGPISTVKVSFGIAF